MTQLTTPTPPVGGDPIVDLSRAPMPTGKTLRMRQNLPFQFTRFLSFNSRIMRMVIKGHH